MRRKATCAAIAALSLTASALVSACGSSGSGGGASTAGAQTTASQGSDYTAVAKANLARYYRGTDRALPTSAPKPQPGKTVWVLACALAAQGCATPANGAMEAGKKLGWHMKLQDGKLDPNQYNRVIRSAIAARVDGLVLAVIDCAPVKSSLEAARSAGIKTMGVFSLDCDDPYSKGTKHFDGEISYGERSTADFFANEYAKNMADYAIAKTDGKAKVIMMREDDTLEPRIVNDGFEKELKRCTACELWTVPFTGADLIGNRLQSKAAAALVKHPDANVVMAPYDAAITLGVGPAVVASGRDTDIILIGAEGLPPNIKQIRDGKGQDFATGAPSRWMGWAGVDGLNRIFAGDPQVDEGIGVMAIDKDHNVPSGAYYDGNPKSRYEQNFLKIWGVG